VTLDVNLSNVSDSEHQEVETKLLTHQLIEQQTHEQQQQQLILQQLTGQEQQLDASQMQLVAVHEDGSHSTISTGSRTKKPKKIKVPKNEEEIGEHVKILYDEKGHKSYKCELCEKILQSKYNLKRHNLAVHKDTRILYGCDECDKNFTSITNYRRHKIMIHGDGKKAYYCDRCDKHLASKDGLRRHYESVHETLGKNFECQICHNKFLRKEYLAKHVKTHEFNYDIMPPDETEAITSTNDDL